MVDMYRSIYLSNYLSIYLLMNQPIYLKPIITTQIYGFIL